MKLEKNYQSALTIAEKQPQPTYPLGSRFNEDIIQKMCNFIEQNKAKNWKEQEEKHLVTKIWAHLYPNEKTLAEKILMDLTEAVEAERNLQRNHGNKIQENSESMESAAMDAVANLEQEYVSSDKMKAQMRYLFVQLKMAQEKELKKIKSLIAEKVETQKSNQILRQENSYFKDVKVHVGEMVEYLNDNFEWTRGKVIAFDPYLMIEDLAGNTFYHAPDEVRKIQNWSKENDVIEILQMADDIEGKILQPCHLVEINNGKRVENFDVFDEPCGLGSGVYVAWVITLFGEAIFFVTLYLLSLDEGCIRSKENKDTDPLLFGVASVLMLITTFIYGIVGVSRYSGDPCSLPGVIIGSLLTVGPVILTLLLFCCPTLFTCYQDKSV